MKAQLLSAGFYLYGVGYYYLNLLLSSEPVNFRHSYLKNPQPDLIQYGDKAVNHYVMEGSADPEITEGPDIPWSGHIGPGSSSENEAVWFGGTEYSMYEWWDYWGYEYRESAKIVVENNFVYWYQYQYWTDSWVKDDKPVAFKVNNRWVKNEDAPVFYNRFALYDVTFTVNNPAPYYWLDFIKEVRPEINPGALSECIRNTITDNAVFDTNNYANILEVVSLLKDIRQVKVSGLIKKARDYFPSFGPEDFRRFSGKRARTLMKKGSKKLADGWLKYRYAYNTTKSDVEQLCSKVVNDRLGHITPDMVLRGSINIAGGELRVKMRLHENVNDVFLSMLMNSRRYGFFPGLYNLWDMIPFSFVADWFTDLGDLLGDLDDSFYFDYFRVDELLVSTKQYQYVDGAGYSAAVKYYERELFEEFPQWEFYTDSHPSGKVKAYRCIDGASLMIGVI